MDLKPSTDGILGGSMVEYEPIIGLEVHAQLNTRTKMFCGCPADYQRSAPNSRVCPVCLGLPGTLPVINEKAVQAVIMTGLALHSNISLYTKFDRKNYPYPDLMKGYQISQFNIPICEGGYLEILAEGKTKKVGITRVHLEEDVAKLAHKVDSRTGEPYSLIDVNRSGVPLMELVGEPDLRSPEEAREYLVKLRSILQYLEVSTGNMEDGSFRCDANVSIRAIGSQEYMARAEVKNMNSFRSVYRALCFEVQRQTACVLAGDRVIQETRGWVEGRGETVSMRSKEHAHDYRYFPEPDLPPLKIQQSWIDNISASLPELPHEKQDRYMIEYGLNEYDASRLTATPAIARFFEDTVESMGTTNTPLATSTKSAANWILSDLGGLLNASGVPIQQSRVSPKDIADLIDLIGQGVIGTVQAKITLQEMFNKGGPAQAIVESLHLNQIVNETAINSIVTQVIEENPIALQDFIKGKETAVRFLVGQVMKVTGGKINPQLANDSILRQLRAYRE